ncbi:LysM peptidoglycan-binding domain-containing protein, partial [Pectobacterium versatile]|nr:LysM peptidoglycan-binding domain-containing protein [Pectobacterium versatile]
LKDSLAEGDIAAIQPAKAVQPASAVATRSVGYKVRPGDTLSSIAKRMNVRTQDLQSWNRLKGNALKVGQTLQVAKATVPVTAGVVASSNT